MGGFLAALQLLTIFPVKRAITPKETARAPAFFPMVGLVIGAALAGIYWAFGLLLPQSVVSALVIAVLVGITGALHLDGLSDTCDGMGGNRTAEERLRIMDDSRVGSFGVVGIMLILLVKYAALVSIPRELAYLALIVMTTTSRWTMTYAILAYPYPKTTGMGKVFKESISLREMVIATVITLVVGIGLMRVAGLAAILFAWLAAVAVATYLKRQLGGLTGDTYGAINEITEVSVLLTVSLLAYKGWLWIG